MGLYAGGLACKHLGGREGGNLLLREGDVFGHRRDPRDHELVKPLKLPANGRIRTFSHVLPMAGGWKKDGQ